MNSVPLAGRTVLVTRPLPQAENLAKLIEAAGGKAILFPVLEILDATDTVTINSMIDRLDEFDIAIFISPNAVNKAMNLIRARRDLPAGLKMAAVGRGSGRELKRYGILEIIAPATQFDSEHLLALPEMQQVSGKRIIIFRGEGGRELLGDTLVARGAHVEYAECYRRQKPSADAAGLLRSWARGEVHAVSVTSTESLRNLFDMVGKLGREWLKKTPIFVPHERIAEAARELGVTQVSVTAAGDEGCVQGLINFFHKTT